MRSHSHIHTALIIIGSYDGKLPLSHWLKNFFKSEKKYGSTDRRQIAHLCYCYYRLGQSFPDINGEERIITAVFLCSDHSNKLIEELKPELNSQIHLTVEKKLVILSLREELQFVFPFSIEISNEINTALYNKSFFIQPDFFIRLRPGSEEKVRTQLEEHGIDFICEDKNALRLLNQTKIEEVIYLDRDAVIQDLNSQKIADVLESVLHEDEKLEAWDCCAASGGKSILLRDRFPKMHLTVSDIRESILINLKKRFQRAGINQYRQFTCDVAASSFVIKQKFDLVLCDAPCSGSGTWSRTPEQMHFFTDNKLGYYAALQKKIVANAAKSLTKDGFFLYITCSVFRKENEEIAEFIQADLSLQLIEMKYLKGYEQKADTLFVALFRKL